MTRLFIITICLLITGCCLAQAFGQSTFNPTGTYVFQGKTTKKDGEIYGYTGSIQVKKINDTKIVMTFYICKGAPSYNSGSFVDTLTFANNVAVHTDEDCVTTFSFTKKGIDVQETKSGPCWGHGVYAHGYFKKESSKQPELKHPLTDEKL